METIVVPSSSPCNQDDGASLGDVSNSTEQREQDKVYMIVQETRDKHMLGEEESSYANHYEEEKEEEEEEEEVIVDEEEMLRMLDKVGHTKHYQ